MILRAIWAVVRGRETLSDLRDQIAGRPVDGPVIWLHGASVGELASAQSVIAALQRETGQSIMVTATRKPAVLTVRGWNMQGITACLAPLDSTVLSRRVIARNRVTRLVVLENELWPARITACHAANIPVTLLSARMSDRSASTWSRFRGLAHAILSPVRCVIPQDDTSARNLIALGVAPDRMRPVAKLKAGYVAPAIAIPPEFATWSRPTTLLAAATHAGEENIVLAAFRMAVKTNPDLRLIIAPRHTTRGDDVARLIADAGFPMSRRSFGEDSDAAVYLADTMGEMALWYSMSAVAFVGGSLMPKGGHTPYEPAAHGCAILHGPHLRNFAEDYAAFHTANAAAKVHDAPSLARAFLDSALHTELAKTAKNAVQAPDIKSITSDLLAD